MARRDERPTQDRIHRVLCDLLHTKVLPELTARHQNDAALRHAYDPEAYGPQSQSGHHSAKTAARRPHHA